MDTTLCSCTSLLHCFALCYMFLLRLLQSSLR